MSVGAEWATNVISLLLTGRWWPVDGAVPAMSAVRAAEPAFFWILAAAAFLLLFVGFVRFVRSGPLAATVAAAWTLAPVLQFLYARHEQMFIWVYYVIYLLPFVMGLLALGVIGVVRPFARNAAVPWAVPWAAAAACVIFFAWATHSARAWQYAHSATLLRESTLLTRPDLDYRSAENCRILTAGMTSAPLSYDANYLLLKSETELALLCFQADRTGRPLFLNQGHQWILESRCPVVARMVRDPSLFEEVTRMEGETATADRLIVKYRPGSVGKSDLLSYITSTQLEFAQARAELEPEQYFLANRPDTP